MTKKRTDARGAPAPRPVDDAPRPDSGRAVESGPVDPPSAPQAEAAGDATAGAAGGETLRLAQVPDVVRPTPVPPAPRPSPPRPRPDLRGATPDLADIPLEEQTPEMRWPPGSWVRVTDLVRHSTGELIEGIAVGDIAQVTAALSQTLVLIFPTRDNRREVLHIESIEAVEAPPPTGRGRRR